MNATLESNSAQLANLLSLQSWEWNAPLVQLDDLFINLTTLGVEMQRYVNRILAIGIFLQLML